jgi:hypothetical protein
MYQHWDQHSLVGCPFCELHCYIACYRKCLHLECMTRCACTCTCNVICGPGLSYTEGLLLQLSICSLFDNLP